VASQLVIMETCMWVCWTRIPMMSKGNVISSTASFLIYQICFLVTRLPPIYGMSGTSELSQPQNAGNYGGNRLNKKLRSHDCLCH